MALANSAALLRTLAKFVRSAFVQCVAAFVVLWIFVAALVQVNKDEKLFMVVVFGGLTFLIGALPFHGVLLGFVRHIGKQKAITFWFLVAAGAIQGLVFIPALFFPSLLGNVWLEIVAQLGKISSWLPIILASILAGLWSIVISALAISLLLRSSHRKT